MLTLTGVYYHPATSERAVLKDVSLEVNKGTPSIISGPSGSGKTSLIEVISGLASPNKGKISWINKRLNERQRKSICGVVFQFPERHFLGLTVLQELVIGHRRLSEEVRSSVLNKVGLSGIDLKELPENLSGGQQRRLAIAVQLIRSPKILLLDEPTAGLDWSVRDEILELVKQISKDQILIIVTHEPDLFSSLNTSRHKLANGILT